MALVMLIACLTACSSGDANRVPANETHDSIRIVTLSPHLAELVFAAGAGDALVGVSAYSNYPDAVLSMPQIGDAFTVDQEQLALLEPDVLLAWHSGTPAHTVEELRNLGYNVEVIRTQGLDDVATALRTIGRLAGTEPVADVYAVEYQSGLKELRGTYADRAPLRVFYQISVRPLYTVNAGHYVSELIELCGGENIFSDLQDLAPLVSEEAVLARDPELLLAGHLSPDDDAFNEWLRWPDMTANQLGNHFYVHSDLLGRATPRLLEAGKAICAHLDAGRKNRAAMSDAP